MHLFIDTTQMMTFGLLNEGFKWKEYFFDPKITVSTKLHSLVFEMLKKNKLEFSDLTSVIYCAGPGSYTGMRMAEGFAQIVEWQKTDVYSFYHYEVPQICGHESGVWISKAFKGEFFFHKWDQDRESSTLVLEKDIISLLEGNKVFSLRGESHVDSIESAEMIQKQSEKVFAHIFDRKIKKELYYYRPLDQEFKRC